MWRWYFSQQPHIKRLFKTMEKWRVESISGKTGQSAVTFQGEEKSRIIRNERKTTGIG